MNDSEKIIASIEAADFIGRSRELERILAYSKEDRAARGLLLLSAPASGSTEILKQTYDAIFAESGETIPFYFAIDQSDGSVKNCAMRFLQNFLQQTVAFRRRDTGIMNSSPDLRELAELAVPSDAYWIDRAVAAFQIENDLPDERAFIKLCLSAPLRAAAAGARVFVMIDDLHEAAHFAGEIDLVEELRKIFSRFDLPFIFAGRRRFLFERMHLLEAETLKLEPLTFSDAGALAENLAGKFDVTINEQTRDLIARQFDGSPVFIRFLFQAASEQKLDLDSFQKVERVYTDEVFGGKIKGFYDEIFSKTAPEIETQKNFLGLIYDALTTEREKMPLESWQSRASLTDKEFYPAMRLLNTHEIVRVTSNQVEAMSENQILTDYVRARFRLEIIAENRALVVGEMLSEHIKRAPQTMARFYRRASAINLRELLSVFDNQEVPRALLDYSIFSSEMKGAPDYEILKYAESETEKIYLPQIVYTAHTAAFYPAFEQVTEKERSAVALGFQQCAYTDEDEIVWIAAEIDSKLEASKDATEFWCDRLEMVALMCNFLNYKIWLTAPEGFSSEAVEVLEQRKAYGSSRKQIELLTKYLKAEKIVGEKTPLNEYEIVVPMGEDTELIAVRAVEEVARRHSFQPKAINQIKTALVEACINAVEHSHSPDRKIYQKFSVENDRLVITISNRGLRLADKKAEEITPDEGRRGWGLKLMRTLMDEVKIERVDDGTRISMVKYLK